MRADFDSEANALDLELFRFKHYDYQEQVDDDFCTVGFAGGRPGRHGPGRRRQGGAHGAGPARDHGPVRVLGRLIRAAL